MAHSLKIVSFNGGLNQDRTNSGKRKKPHTEQHLRDFAAKVRACNADVVNLQEFSPAWAKHLLSQLSEYEMVPLCHGEELRENYLVTFFRSRTMVLLSSDAVAPFDESRGQNLRDRRALAMTFKKKPTGELCRVMNWHAVDGKWTWTGAEQKEAAVRTLVEVNHRAEIGVLASAQDKDPQFLPWVFTGDFNKITNRSCQHVLDSLPATYHLASDGNFRDHYITNFDQAAVTCDFDFHASPDGQHSAFFFQGTCNATALQPRLQPRKRHKGPRGRRTEDLAAALVDETIAIVEKSRGEDAEVALDPAQGNLPAQQQRTRWADGPPFCLGPASEGLSSRAAKP